MGPCSCSVVCLPRPLSYVRGHADQAGAFADGSYNADVAQESIDGGQAALSHAEALAQEVHSLMDSGALAGSHKAPCVSVYACMSACVCTRFA